METKKWGHDKNSLSGGDSLEKIGMEKLKEKI